MVWQEHARCAEVGTELFFPPERKTSGRAIQARYEAAKQVCVSCPVSNLCLEYALEYEERERVKHAGEASEAGHADPDNRPYKNFRFGVWGGTTPAEREAIWNDRKWPGEGFTQLNGESA